MMKSVKSEVNSERWQWIEFFGMNIVSNNAKYAVRNMANNAVASIVTFQLGNNILEVLKKVRISLDNLVNV